MFSKKEQLASDKEHLQLFILFIPVTARTRKPSKIPACGKFAAADKKNPGTNRFRG
jgi:hypothetical protein